jgi:beta-glucanase (GH16 family)
MPYFKYDGSAATETPGPSSNFYGANVAETITGTAAGEGLWGSDNDVLIGGAGADTYYLQGGGITVSEAAGGGVDQITAWANTNLARTPFVENLNIGGQRTYGAGNGLDNLIVASGSGTQQLYGGAGQDVLVGGPAADTFLVVKGQGSDAIYNFDPGHDVLRLSAGLTSFAQVQQRLAQVGSDVRLDLGDGEGVVFRNLSAGQLTAQNFQLQLDTSKLGALTFHDEFSGQLSLWDAQSNLGGIWRPDYDLQGAQGAGSYTLTSNGEQQIYTSPYFRDHPGDFSESPFTSNGETLSITARPSSNPEIFGYHYTSGMLSSKESFAQTYGYFEMRADLPDAAGGWPAFWLLPADRSWPPELDVMEALTSDPNATWVTAHSNASGSHTMAQGLAFTPETVDGFHTYGVLWTATDIAWFVDGAEVFRTATPADMHKPMYMVANLALGGWAGNVAAGQLPAEMKIDYIRTYALADGSSTVALDNAHAGGAPPVSPSVPSTPMALYAPAEGGLLQGGSAADTLTGADGRNTLMGGDGADRILGGAGFNQVNGNKGEDSIVGRSNTGDWLLGGQGSDQIDASQSAGRNIINGNIGADTVTGGAGDDVVRGGQGDDLIHAGAGDDWISGDRGVDTLVGGAGADTFHHFAGAGVAVVTDFSLGEGDRVHLDAGTAYTASQQGADVVVDITGGGQLVLQHTELSSLGSGWITLG